MSKTKTSKLDLFSFGTNNQAQAEAAETTPAPAEAAPAAAPVEMTRGKKYAPMSVYLSAEQREIIAEIAKATGQTKHAVLQYAVRRVCREWNDGIFPEMEVKPKLK